MATRARFATQLLGACLLAASSTLAIAQAPATPAKPAVGTPVAPSEVFGKLLDGYEKNFVSAAEAMPEDKFNFAPPTTAGEFKGVRTFGEEVKHVAIANNFYFHDPAAPLVDNRADFDKLKTKAEIVKALKDSFAMAHTYINAITPENAFLTAPGGGTRAGHAAGGIAHLNDHYGQMVVYLRMNGIVPPASRK